MSDTTRDVYEAVQRLSRPDPTLKYINLACRHYTDAKLDELVDCLLAHPDAVTTVYLDINKLTDQTGVKLARYLAASSTIQTLGLSHNQLGSGTYLAVAAALCVNTSLRFLSLHGNQAVDRTRIEAAFVEALRLNPDRPPKSEWWVCSALMNFEELKATTDRFGPSSMLAQLDFAQDCLLSTEVRK